MTEYEKQAADFLAETQTEFKVHMVGCFPYFDGDKKPRDVYSVTLSNARGFMTFNFGDSINNTQARKGEAVPYNRKGMTSYRLQAYRNKKQRQHKKPSAYDVLACLQKYDVGTFKDFCAEFGYDEDSRKAEKLYFAVQEEYSNLSRLFSEEQMDALREIQ